MKLRIEYLFCGGCNPLYDRRLVYESLLKHFEDKAVFLDSGHDKIIIILNGCPYGCIQGIKEPPNNVKVINSQKYMINLRGDISHQGIISWMLQQLAD